MTELQDELRAYLALDAVQAGDEQLTEALDRVKAAILRLNGPALNAYINALLEGPLIPDGRHILTLLAEAKDVPDDQPPAF